MRRTGRRQASSNTRAVRAGYVSQTQAAAASVATLTTTVAAIPRGHSTRRYDALMSFITISAVTRSVARLLLSTVSKTP